MIYCFAFLLPLKRISYLSLCIGIITSRTLLGASINNHGDTSDDEWSLVSRTTAYTSPEDIDKSNITTPSSTRSATPLTGVNRELEESHFLSESPTSLTSFTESYESAENNHLRIVPTHTVLATQVISPLAAPLPLISTSDSYILIKKAQENDFQGIQKLIRSQTPLNAQDERGYNALLYATQNGNNDLVTFLIANGAPLNHQNKSGETALLIASMMNHHTIVATLLTYDAHPCIPDKKMQTPLSYASAQGNKMLVEILLAYYKKYKLPLKHTDAIENSPLYLASFYRHSHVLEMLTEYVRYVKSNRNIDEICSTQRFK